MVNLKNYNDFLKLFVIFLTVVLLFLAKPKTIQLQKMKAILFKLPRIKIKILKLKALDYFIKK